MKIHLERLAQQDVGVTLVDCPELLLNLFPQPRQAPAPPFSVLMIDDEIPPEGDLVINAQKLRPVTLGVPGIALLVGRTAKLWSPANADDPPPRIEMPPPNSGDLEFLAEAETRLRSDDLRRDLGGLVEHIRALHPRGTLQAIQRGFVQARRYVNVPNNFVAFTIERRGLVVHARRSSMMRTTPLKIMSDRRPYMRFRVRSSEDVEAALPLIEASWRRG